MASLEHDLGTTKGIFTKPVVMFIGIAYGITWVLGFTIFLLHNNLKLSDYQLNFFHSFAALGPTIGAMVASYLCYGSRGLKKLLSRISLRELDLFGVFTMLSPIVLFLLGVAVYFLVNSHAYNFGSYATAHWSSLPNLINWLLPLITYAFFEEIGWRGFLLPHFQTRLTAWKATLVLTVIWALWHLPFFFYRFQFSAAITVGFLFGMFVGAVILTSLFNSSKGMLVPAMIFHFLNNLFSDFDTDLIAPILSIGFVFIAMYIYRKFGRETLSRTTHIKNYSEYET